MIRILSALLLLAPAVFAEDVPVRTLEPERETQTQAGINAAKREAARRRVIGKEAPASYEQVLADPDNVDLNYRFARVQIRRGDLSGALSTLERILIIQPELSKARLLYAIVLFRAGNLTEAEREFKTLQKGKIPYELRSEFNRYLNLIRRKTRKTRFTATLGGGMDFNENMNSAPASGTRLLVDLPIILDSASTRKSDVAKIMLANAGVVHDFGLSGHQLSTTLGYYRAEQTNSTNLNLQSYSAGLNARYRTPWADFLPSASFSHLLLAQTTYLRSREFGMRIERRLGKKFDVYGQGTYARQSYNRTQVVPLGDQRTGDRVSGGLGIGMIVGRSSRFSLSYTHTSQGAAAAFNAYRRDTFTVEDIYILPVGQFLLFSATANLDRYIEPELAISALRRNDNNYRLRATYGLPLGFLGEILDNALWNVTYEYYHALSSITNYSYTNNRISTLFTYKWDVGL